MWVSASRPDDGVGNSTSPVVVHVRVLPDVVDEAVLPQHRRAMGDAVDPARAVHRYTEESGIV